MEAALQHLGVQLFWEKWGMAEAVNLRQGQEDGQLGLSMTAFVWRRIQRQSREDSVYAGHWNDSDTNQDARGCWELEASTGPWEDAAGSQSWTLELQGSKCLWS